MSRIVCVCLPGVLLGLAALGWAQAPENQQKLLADALAAHRQALGSVDQIRTLGAESTLFMGRQRSAGVKSWWSGWGPDGRWMRQFRRTPAGQRLDFFGPAGTSDGAADAGFAAFVLNGRYRARYRPNDRRTRPYYYVAKALAHPFALLAIARDPKARNALKLAVVNRYHVIALPRDEYGVRTLYLLEQKTGRLAGVRFEIEENKPFATVQFENHGRVKCGTGEVVMPYGVHVELRLPVESDRSRQIQERRITFKERVDTWICNPSNMPARLSPPSPPSDLPKGFLRRTFGTGPEPSDVAVGDLDRDGRNDIAVACIGGLYVHFGGAEDKPVFVPLGAGTHRGCRIVDFDLDGRPDVMTMSWLDPTETLFLVEFDKQRKPASRKLYAAPHFGYGLAVDDFDLDGLPDYVTTGFGSRNVVWKFGNGSGGVRFVGTGWPLVKQGHNPERGFGVAVGDFNGDGIRDVAVAEPGRPRVVIFEGQPNVSFRPSAELDAKNVGLARPVDVHFVDLDGDGRDELIVAQDDPRRALEGGVGVFLNTGESLKAVYLAAGDRVQAVRSGDLDGDGAIDIVAASYGTDQLAWLRGLGGGKFDKPRFFGAGRGTTRVVVADLNADRKLDLVAVNNLDDTISVWANEAGKQVASAAPRTTAVVGAFAPGEFRLKGLSEQYEFMAEWRLPLGIADPSGVAFLHGDAVHTGLVLVSDKRNGFFRATVDRQHRRLLVSPEILLRGVPKKRLDLEGIAFDHVGGTLFIGCESDSTVIRSTIFGRLLGRAKSEIEVGDNDGIEAIALRRRLDGTPLLYVFKERTGISVQQPPVYVYDIQESPFKLIRRGDPLRLPVALVDQTGAVASGEKLFVISRFARSIGEFDFDGDGFARSFKVASYRWATEDLLGYPKLPKFGMVEGIARARNGDLFLIVDNNGNEIGVPGKNRGREGRLIWLRNVTARVAGKSDSRVQLRVITIPCAGALKAPAGALAPARAKKLAADLERRIRAGDDPAALSREHKLARGTIPGVFWMIRPPATRNATDISSASLPRALARVGFRIAVGDVAVCEFDKAESPFGYLVVQRIE